MDSWIPIIARLGYSARGVVYLIIGIFALLAAFGYSEAKGTTGALQSLLAQPFGKILVWLMIVGLACYSVWRVVQAWRDPDGHGSGGKGLAIRAGLVGGAISYALLALVALGMVSRWGAQPDGEGEAEAGGGDPSGGWLAAIHEAGFGTVLIYAIAAVVLVVGLAHVVKGWRADFEERFRCPEAVRSWLFPLSRFGLIARGIVFIVLAALIAFGGSAYRPEARPGLREALEAVQTYSYGWLLLAAIALGLMAFGLYSLGEARYRTISPR